jgi:hypothetical protein
MGEWSVSQPGVKSPCTHLLYQEWSRKRAVSVFSIKYNRFPMKLLQVFVLGKVDEYKDVDLLTVSKKKTAIISELRLTKGTQRMKK